MQNPLDAPLGSFDRNQIEYHGAGKKYWETIQACKSQVNQAVVAMLIAAFINAMQLLAFVNQALKNGFSNRINAVFWIVVIASGIMLITSLAGAWFIRKLIIPVFLVSIFLPLICMIIGIFATSITYTPIVLMLFLWLIVSIFLIRGLVATRRIAKLQGHLDSWEINNITHNKTK